MTHKLTKLASEGDFHAFSEEFDSVLKNIVLSKLEEKKIVKEDDEEEDNDTNEVEDKEDEDEDE